MRMNKAWPVVVISAIGFFPSAVLADWTDWLNVITGDGKQEAGAGAGAVAALADSEIADGLRAALEKGVMSAVERLGAEDGFLANTKVRIPVPKSLELIQDGLRTMGRADIADDFVESMNRAAERAVPKATAIFTGAIRKMTIADARGILDGGETAATEYLQRTSKDELRDRFTPIVDGAVREAGATRSYQMLLDKAGLLGKFVNTDKLNLTDYVTDKALDGIYLMIGQEEKKIRANPAARSTELLKKVFGS